MDPWLSLDVPVFSSDGLITQGKQSHVFISRFIVKQMGIGKGLTFREVSDLTRHLSLYQQVLRQRGWSTPITYFMQINDHEAGSYLTTLEQYIEGPSFTDILAKEGVPQALSYLELILHLLANESTSEFAYERLRFHRLKYGVDLKPDNLVLDVQTRELFLVDTFAPKIITSEGQWGWYSKKLDELGPEELMVVTGTREGISLRLFRLMGISKTRHYSNILSSLETNGMRKEEVRFIASEIESDYPLLDYIYSLV